MNKKMNKDSSTNWWKYWVESLTEDDLPDEFWFSGRFINNKKKFIEKIKGEKITTKKAQVLMKISNWHLKNGR
jgi:hypothetical protein